MTYADEDAEEVFNALRLMPVTEAVNDLLENGAIGPLLTWQDFAVLEDAGVTSLDPKVLAVLIHGAYSSAAAASTANPWLPDQEMVMVYQQGGLASLSARMSEESLGVCAGVPAPHRGPGAVLQVLITPDLFGAVFG